MPPSKFREMIPGEARVSYGIIGAKWNFKGYEAAFQRALIKRCEKSPLVLLIDEAHMLNPEVLRHLAYSTQHVMGQNRPFMLVLAGTPPLDRRIAEAGATFLERSDYVRVGRLSREGAQDALLKPFERAARQTKPVRDADAVAQALDECHDYSYFLQLMGSALWKASSEGISAASLAKALPAFQEKKKAFYAGRYNELEDMNLHNQAGRLSEKFRKSASAALPLSELMAHPNAVSAEDVRKIHETGYIWKPSGSTRYEPGIPSLMDYVLDELDFEPDAARDSEAPSAEGVSLG